MILDYIDKLELAADSEDYMHEAQMTLARLSQGLFWLYGSVYQAEQRVRRTVIQEKASVIMVLDKDSHADWLSCAFQWYAVSLYNYVRLTGWLATKNTDFTNEYVKRAIPKITEYRHKVAAHFAITAPRNDNEADLRSSIITNIVYAHGFLRAGALSEIITNETGEEVETKNKTSWSLTKTHQTLCQRYWPNGPLDAFESIKLSAGATRKFRINWED